jgi:hypothetical protein
MNADLSLHVILALAVVVIAGHLVGRLLARAGQPPVVGEVLSGILLGPSLLGRLAPDAEAYLFPASARPALAVIAQLGVILYMFVVARCGPASRRSSSCRRRASRCRSRSGSRSRPSCFPPSLLLASRFCRLRSFSASRCRSPRFRSSRASSPTAA